MAMSSMTTLLDLYQSSSGSPYPGSPGPSLILNESRADTEPYPGTLLSDTAPWPAPPATLSPSALKDAPQLDLTLTRASPAAQALVAAVANLIEAQERAMGRRKRGEAERAKIQAAIAGVLGGTLVLWMKAKPWFRSRAKDSFTGAPVAARQFAAAVDGMVSAGLLQVSKAIRFATDHFDTGNPMSQGRAARHWPTEALLHLAAEHGVIPTTVRSDFRSVAPTKPPKVTSTVALESLGLRGGLRGQPMAFDADDDAVAAILADIDEQNRLAEATVVSGCLPPRWKRCFKGDWSLYGRWHALGSDGNYQRISEADRLSLIAINGEPVVEVDIGASHLSLMHGLLRLPLPYGDLYAAVSEFPRDAVKTWITATLGKGSPVTKWARGTRVPDAVRAYDPVAVGEAVMARYPFLRDPTVAVRHLAHLGPPKRILTHHLTGLEARIITTVMGFLRGPDHPDWPEPRVLALPMHDGLIVPVSALEQTLDYLWRAGAAQAGVVFRLKVSVADQEPAYPPPPGDLAGRSRKAVEGSATVSGRGALQATPRPL